jgi:CRISP-associated protein Cas1
VASKIQNSRNLLLRSARDSDNPDSKNALGRAADRLACVLDTLAQSQTLDSVRGCEGDAARCYFEAFNHMIRQQSQHFSMTERSRRPPLDPLNALLSFLYSVLTHDAASALQATGLDPAVGFLHADRPGRLSLALDLVEEFRALIADRLALAMINLRQVAGAGFAKQPGGAVVMDGETRKKVLATLTQRKREEVLHPLLGERIAIGKLLHIQARLLARHVRGDLEQYPALVVR